MRGSLKVGTLANRDREAGTTLIEFLVALAIVAILMTLGLTAFDAYGKVMAHRGALRDVAGVLRNTQIRAVAEAKTYQCRFDTSSVPHTLHMYRDGDNPPDPNELTRTYTLDKRLRFDGVNFVHSDPSYPSDACLLLARGSASKGSLNITRADNGRAYEITVEGLTARVSYEGG
jgi:prepilin-type N-terminal cleavage/methylation domain-containing protein